SIASIVLLNPDDWRRLISASLLTCERPLPPQWEIDIVNQRRRSDLVDPPRARQRPTSIITTEFARGTGGPIAMREVTNIPVYARANTTRPGPVTLSTNT